MFTSINIYGNPLIFLKYDDFISAKLETFGSE